MEKLWMVMNEVEAEYEDENETIKTIINLITKNEIKL